MTESILSFFYSYIILELYMKLNSDTPFVYSRYVAVCKSSHIVNSKETEDILDSECYFHIRC